MGDLEVITQYTELNERDSYTGGGSRIAVTEKSVYQKQKEIKRE